MRCPLCGLDNNPSVGVCARCGAPLNGTPPPPTNTTQFAPGSASPGPIAPPPTPQFAPPLPPAPRSGPSTGVLLSLLGLGMVALLSLALVVVIVARGRPDKPVAAAQPTVAPPATTAAAAKGSARDQAAAIDALLDRSAASRAKLNSAIERVQRCKDVPAALTDMRTVGDERTKQIADTEATDVSALDNGEAVRSTLRAALGFALAADAHFVSWAEPAATGDCKDTTARNAAWQRGQASSKQAQGAKKQFIAVWNPIAGPLGLAERSTDKI
ncbi:hypothetical protein BJ973_003670 [Actinoplanes tereljensis]|uniref:Uncharacterized protein n=1 Tax=Paractinoplanes tereljensis TaxID=571912 RepID=A0A919NW17_9ACTN|nr:hypothetical protein [Actinoplanes tereljensis]GIF25393.1 hypothetical protein Ate02nite_81230 [Actinoplanes tereljensis]